MREFTIMRKIEIDAAHRVPHHGSKCFKVHGHRYVIEATCSGPVIEGGEQTGMVMDFGFLKACMMEVIHDPCDHGIILWDMDPMLESMGLAYLGQEAFPWWKVFLMRQVPTAENLAKLWHAMLDESIGRFFEGTTDTRPKLVDVIVWETPNCKARYPW